MAPLERIHQDCIVRVLFRDIPCLPVGCGECRKTGGVGLLQRSFQPHKLVKKLKGPRHLLRSLLPPERGTPAARATSCPSAGSVPRLQTTSAATSRSPGSYDHLLAAIFSLSLCHSPNCVGSNRTRSCKIMIISMLYLPPSFCIFSYSFCTFPDEDFP